MKYFAKKRLRMEFMKEIKNCLVTGASGFIGRELCAFLKAKGCYVIALNRSHAEGPWDIEILADIQTLLDSSLLSNEVDTVFHLAGKAHALSERKQEDAEYDAVNAIGTEHTLDLARRLKASRFVYFSTVKVAGEYTSGMINESVSPMPETPYGRSKYKGELAVLAEQNISHSSILRLCAVYGKGSKGNLAKMQQNIGKGRFIPFARRENQVSMVHVNDVIQAAWLAVTQSCANRQIYYVTDDVSYNPADIVNWMYQGLGKIPPPFHIPYGLLSLIAKCGDLITLLRGRRFFFDSTTLTKLYANAVYSNEKLKCELGFKPQHSLQTELLKN